MSIVSVKNDTVTRTSVINAAIPLAPVINSINVLIASAIADDTAVDIAGGQTIQINGTGFISGAIITLGGSAVTTVYVNANTLTFTAPAKTAATYAIYVLNPDGGTAIYIPGLVYSGTPVWTTTAISPASQYETNSIATGALVTTGGDAPIVYTLASGTLPAGAVLNSSTGELTGTASATASNTTYVFTIKATDAQLQDTTSASFSLTINTDVVTMANTSVTLEQNTTSSTALTATSAAGKAISYSSTQLPAGLSISGTTVTGTPTVTAVTATTFTATAATTNRTATATITWTVSVASDQYVMYNTLLLSGSASTETFVTDASTNNFALAIVGDTKPSNFNPYTPGYYSAYFDGGGDFLDVPHSTNQWIGLNQDFTIECWFYATVGTGERTLIAKGYQGSPNYAEFGIVLNGSSQLLGLVSASGGSWLATPTDPVAIIINTWNHVAMVRSGTTITLYKNGVVAATSTGVGAALYNHTGTIRIGQHSNGSNFSGYISNARVVIGTAVYTSAFTPSLTPLTAIANTNLLTCQSNNFADNSINSVVITKAGDTTVSSTTPFAPNTAYAAYGSTYFDGTGDYLSTPQNAAFNLGTGAFTVEAWVYITASNGANQRIIGLGDGANGGGPYTGWSFWIPNSLTQLSWYRYDGTETNLVVSYTFSVNTWYHVVAVRNGSSNLSLYVNGSRVYNNASATLSYNNVNSNPLYIGVTSDGSGGGYSTKYFNGYISNTRVVAGTAVYDPTVATLTVPSTPLTAVANTRLLTCQTNQPASNSMFLDSSTNAFPVTRAGNTSAGTFSPYGANWSNYFDGSDGLVPAAGLSAAMGTGFAGNIISFELWIYPTSFTNGGDGNGIMGAYGAVAANGRWLVSMERSATTTAKLEMAYTTGTGSQNNIASTASAILLNQWNHIAVTVDATTAASSTIKLFANGVLLNTFTGQNMSTHTTYYRQVYIGNAQSQYVSPMIGYISNFRILKGAFAYTANYTVPTAPLTATANTVFLTCQSNGLVDNGINAFTISRSGDTSVQRFSPFAPQTQTAITHSAYFDGSGDYLVTPANAALTFGTGDLTLECWIYQTTTSTSTYRVIFADNVYGSAGGYTLYSYNNALNLWKGGSGAVEVIVPAGTITLNTWTHVAWTRSGSSNRLFINGTQVGSTTTDATNYTSTTSYIGASQVGTLPFAGYISNARIVKGTAVYTTTFTPPTTPLTAISGTSLLTLQSPTFIDNSSNNFALTAFDNAKPRTINPFGFTSLTAAYSAATYGASAYFDGSGDYVSVPSNSNWSFAGQFTWEGWFYWNVSPAAGSIIGAQTAGGFDLYNTGSALSPNVYGSGNVFTSTFFPLVGVWYHIAVTRNSSNLMTMWVNGVSVGSATTSASYTTGTYYIGSVNNTNAMQGYISNFRIVKGTAVYKSNFVPPAAPLTAITNTSLLLNMNSAGIYDSASMNDLETLADAKRVSTHTPYAGSYYSNYFDGTGDYLTAPASSVFAPGTGDFTVEGWFNITATLPNYGASIWSQTVSGTNYFQIIAGNDAGPVTANYVGFFSTLSGGGTAIYSNSSNPFTLNTWNHFAVVRASGTVTVYLNGVAGTPTSNTTNLTNTSYVPTIGRVTHSATQFFTGYISNLRYVKDVAVYTGSTFTVPTTPLTAIANTSLLTCQSNRFVDNSSNLFAITKYDNTSVQSFNPFQRNSGTSLYFDGTGDYLKAPYTPGLIFGTGDFTIECWLYQVAFVSDMVITASYATWASSVNFYFATRAGSPNILVFRAGDSIPITLNGNTAILANSWTHVAVSRASGVTRMFVDGVAQSATHTGSINIGATANSTGIGASNNAIEPINGYINDLRITKGIARYTSTFTPPTSAFVAR